MNDKTKVYINKTHSGNIAYEDEKYIFNYLDDVQNIVSLTMPVRAASWYSKTLHPIFQMNMPEGALKEAIVNAGLPTPDFYMSDDYKMFIMKRFDVDMDDSYLGFEDMCVLTARNTSQKYDGSYEECVRVIKDIISAEKKQESLKIFFKAIVMNHLLKNGDGHLKNYGILYKNDFEDSYLAPIYDVITTTIYIKNDIPALRLGDGKLWWKEKTYKVFAKQSCGLSNMEYQTILLECKEAIQKTKKEINQYKTNDIKIKEFLEDLQECWSETI